MILTKLTNLGIKFRVGEEVEINDFGIAYFERAKKISLPSGERTFLRFLADPIENGGGKVIRSIFLELGESYLNENAVLIRSTNGKDASPIGVGFTWDFDKREYPLTFERLRRIKQGEVAA